MNRINSMSEFKEVFRQDMARYKINQRCILDSLRIS